MGNNTSETNPSHKCLPRMWAIFYELNGKIYPCVTNLGCAEIWSENVNVYCDETKLNEIYEQTIAMTRRTERLKDSSAGHAYWEGCLKPEWRNGRVFISRVGSKDFPATLLKEPYWQGDKHNDGKKLWAIRVPCKINS